MPLEMTDELREALAANNAEAVEIADQATNRVYVVVDAEVHRRAMQALRAKQELEGIRQGIADMEAGRTMSVEESKAASLARLGFPAKTE